MNEKNAKDREMTRDLNTGVAANDLSPVQLDVVSHSLNKTARADRSAAIHHVQVFDKPMCCSTGVCGPQVDPILPRFAADLDWLRDQGHRVDRFNLAQQPEAFATHSVVQKILAAEGVDCLPLILVGDRIVSRGDYPSREDLVSWTGTPLRQTTEPVASPPEGCCGDSGCC